MSVGFATRSLLEKAALDNGFGLERGEEEGWLIYEAHAAPARICLTASDGYYALGTNHQGTVREMQLDLQQISHAPPGFDAWLVPDTAALNHLAGRIWRLARSLPNEPLKEFARRLAEPASTTEVERLRRERIGQDVFRERLMLFWENGCAVTDVRHPRLLRASHIIPWARCESDEERLNVHNGLLLVAHLDAAFDAGLISFDETGLILIAPSIAQSDLDALGIVPAMSLRSLSAETAKRLSWHREHLFGNTV